MKVKVNGAWVDVPAFKVVEKGNGHGVIEGEITIVGNVKSLQIDYDELPNEPFFASLLYDDVPVISDSRTNGCNYIFNGQSYIQHNTCPYTATWLNNYSVLSASPMHKDNINFLTFGSQYLVVGKYKYFIAY